MIFLLYCTPGCWNFFNYHWYIPYRDLYVHYKPNLSKMINFHTLCLYWYYLDTHFLHPNPSFNSIYKLGSVPNIWRLIDQDTLVYDHKCFVTEVLLISYLLVVPDQYTELTKPFWGTIFYQYYFIQLKCFYSIVLYTLNYTPTNLKFFGVLEVDKTNGTFLKHSIIISIYFICICLLFVEMEANPAL